MKKVVLFILVFLTVFTTSCHQRSTDKSSEKQSVSVTESDSEVISGSQAEELKNFYIQYVEGCETGNKELLDSLEDRYITKELSRRFQEAYERDDFLEYDPILNSQECYAEMLKGLEVVQDTENRNIYTIVRDNPYREDGKSRITVLLKEEDGSYKIDKILSDSNFR